MKTYLAEKSQLDAQNQTLSAQNQTLTQINAKIAPKNLASVTVGLLDFNLDDVNIESGGLDSINRRITT